MTAPDYAMRIEKLEADNKLLNCFLTAILILAATLASIDATERFAEKITTHELDVVDKRGQVRVMIGTTMDGGVECPGIVINDARGATRAMMYEQRGDAGLSLYGLGPERVLAQVNQSGEPSVELRDAAGFSMNLGSKSLATGRRGEKRQTSADSIIMFDNDPTPHVIWHAP